MSSYGMSTAFQVVYNVRYPWHTSRMHRMFETLEAAEEFCAPLVAAARQASDFHNIPFVRVVGVVEFVSMTDGVTRRFCLGPSVDGAFVSGVAIE